MRISLVIPAYNREALIREAIESALEQTEKIDEIIIIDNDSLDATFRIAEEYVAKYDHIKAFRNEKNIGMINNWNRGIQKATGDYVSVLHSDDIIPKNWCETVKSAIRRNEGKDVALFFGIYACFQRKQGKIEVVSRIENFSKDTFFPAEESVKRLWENFYGNPNCSAAIVYKKSLFDEIGYFNPDKGVEADQDFHIRVLNRYNSYFIDQELLYYRRHEFQGYDFKQETESAETSLKRLLNAVSIQKENLKDPELVKYTYCGVLLYALKFLLTLHFSQALRLFKIPGIFNRKTLTNFPRFFWMLVSRKYFNKSFILKFRKTRISLLFFLFSCLVLRSLIFSSYEGIGHNWDWGFPAMQPMFERINELSEYSWNGFGLGKELNLQAHFAVNEIISWSGAILGTKWAVVLLIFSTLTISFFSFKPLLDFLSGRKSDLHYLPSVLYAFSPFLFNEIIGGSWYMWVSYAFAPVLFLNLIRYVHFRRLKHLTGYLLATVFVLISLQNFVVIESIAAVFLLFNMILNRDHLENVKGLVAGYLWAHLILFLASLYWIVPFIYSLKTFYLMVTSVSFTGGFEGIRDITQGVLEIFSLAGYLDRNMYYHAIPDGALLLFNISVAAFWVMLSATFFLKRQEEKQKKNVLLWFSILILLILVIKGGNAPFGSLTMFIFQHFPLMSLYRSPQHLMFAAAFLVPILMALTIHSFIRSGFSKKTVIVLFLLIIGFWTSAWWLNGDLGREILSAKKKDHIDLYTIAPTLRKIYEYNENSFLAHRILFLPTAFSPDYLPNEYQRKAQGGQPEYSYLKNPTFSAEFNALAGLIDDKLCYNEEFDLLKYLSITNTRYVSLREDIYPHHSKCGIFKVWDADHTRKLIENTAGLAPVNGLEGLYLVGDEYFLQRFFVPKKVVVSDREVENIPDIVSTDDYEVGTALFLKSQNKERTDVLDTASIARISGRDKDPTLEFKKISPVKYRMRIHGAKGVFPLVFNESFHEGWKLYPGESDSVLFSASAAGRIGNYHVIDGNVENQASQDELERYIRRGWVTGFGETNNISFVSKDFRGAIQNNNLPDGDFWENWFRKGSLNGVSGHLVVNGYANAWIIDPEEACSARAAFCKKNQDGTYDFEIVAEFWPQRLMSLGLGLSVAGLAVFLVFFGIVRMVKAARTGKGEAL